MGQSKENFQRIIHPLPSEERRIREQLRDIEYSKLNQPCAPKNNK